MRLWPELDGGALMDVGCYCVSGARLLAGEPKRVHGDQVVGPTGVDLTFAGTMRFPGDVVATFHASMALPLPPGAGGARLRGTLLVEAPWRVDFGGDVLLRRGGQVERVDVPERTPTGSSWTTSPLPPPASGRRSSGAPTRWPGRTLEALYKSAERGEAVQVTSTAPAGSWRSDRRASGG